MLFHQCKRPGFAPIYVVASGINLFLRNIKQYNHLSYASFKIVPLRNSSLLPATVEVLETFHEVILWKPFQLFCRILNDVISINKAPTFHCWFQSRKQVKISSSQVKRVWRTLQHCHIALCQEILEQNRPVCWSIVAKEKPTVDSLFFGALIPLSL
jgi:hypothetical protein